MEFPRQRTMPLEETNPSPREAHPSARPAGSSPLYLVGIPTPLKNMTSSVGMMTFPICENS